MGKINNWLWLANMTLMRRTHLLFYVFENFKKCWICSIKSGLEQTKTFFLICFCVHCHSSERHIALSFSSKDNSTKFVHLNLQKFRIWIFSYQAFGNKIIKFKHKIINESWKYLMPSPNKTWWSFNVNPATLLFFTSADVTDSIFFLPNRSHG